MQTSDEITEIAKALIKFHKSVGKIRKDAKNPHFGKKYASLSSILDAISAPLTDAGLSVVQLPTGEYGLTTRIIHESGEWIESTYSMRPARMDPQGMGSAITYQRRYALSAALSLNIDDDDDGNAASQPPKSATIKTAVSDTHKTLVSAIHAICKTRR